MAIRIQPYEPRHAAAVANFNRRLLAGGAPAEVLLSESATAWLPKRNGVSVFNEFFIACDEGGAVRGAYAIKRQRFLIRGEAREAGFYHHPVSEGIVSRAWPQLGLQMLTGALRCSPLLYCLGMGGTGRPLPRMLAALKWRVSLLPFRFRIVRPARFLREMRILHASAARSLCANAAAWTGVGWLALKGGQALRARSPRPAIQYERVPDFGPWADAVWERARAAYETIAVRDSETLSLLFPAANARFTRIRVQRRGGVVGWAVLGMNRDGDREQYGGLRTGWILDCLAAPAEAAAVIWAAARALEDLGAELILSNQSHPAWVAALDRAGFWKAPSNFLFAASPQFGGLAAGAHFTRADGDGLLPYQ